MKTVLSDTAFVDDAAPTQRHVARCPRNRLHELVRRTTKGGARLDRDDRTSCRRRHARVDSNQRHRAQRSRSSARILCMRSATCPIAYHPAPIAPRRCRPTAIDLTVLGWGLGAYRYTRYKATDRAPARLVDAGHVRRGVAAQPARSDRTRARPDQRAGLRHAARSNSPTPRLALANEFGATCTVIVGDDLLKQNFPTIHAVGRASTNAPRLIDLTWGNAADPRVTLIGKGVCFDSGGLDIKPSTGMRHMKKDMGGAAHVLGIARLVMSQQLPVRLRVLIPAVENAISGDAYRPGDIIRTRKGTTVEIDNTDAEGRLVLCDALALACETDPGLIVDFATLTGAARTALGTELPALFCNDDALADGLLSAGRDVADPLWRMPLHQPYRRMLDSKVADLVNSPSSPYAGAITAALFLEAFVTSRRAVGAHRSDGVESVDRAGPTGGRRSDGPARGVCSFGQSIRPLITLRQDHVHRDESLQDCIGTRRRLRGRVARARELSRHACPASRRFTCSKARRARRIRCTHRTRSGNRARRSSRGRSRSRFAKRTRRRIRAKARTSDTPNSRRSSRCCNGDEFVGTVQTARNERAGRVGRGARRTRCAAVRRRRIDRGDRTTARQRRSRDGRLHESCDARRDARRPAASATTRAAASASGARAKSPEMFSCFATCASIATATRCCSASTRRGPACHTGRRRCFYLKVDGDRVIVTDTPERSPEEMYRPAE